ncbi:SCO2525 family SAM-dependent methyltransferase [Frankia sp. AiPs1]|uniref:SCO2525 family SAM-dependent methyltransferase n=1 Tax=Frankia sp. AiPs1 TaxID=573493 RepID=UPI002042CF6C|nr:SCO2525 family SAM-dependent methyltransferase [Frankia sp. AiPs1]MCM3922507.1 SCO2525 family SAM-dependent methyltransferase [Frankia sp. AiPs1]
MSEPQMAQVDSRHRPGTRPTGRGADGEALERRPSPVDAPRNADFPWDEFDTTSYLRHNYRSLRPDDRQILERVRDFFAGSLPAGGARGLDVGSGPNLYPALAMLPLCRTITLFEPSISNVAWLRDEIGDYGRSWDPFWELLCARSRYRRVGDPRQTLADRVSVQQGSVFELPRRGWDVGTMFFVAESISERPEEFEDAVRRFLEALRAGAPFAAAFMENSDGYDVGGRRFPAVAVEAGYIRRILETAATDLRLERIGIGSDVLRAGYTGMIVACGRVRAT